MGFNPSKTFWLIVSALLFCATTAAQTPTPTPVEDDKPETVFTEEIKLNVSAFDENGDFVFNVTKDDIVIVEDNRLHQANSIRRIPANVLIVLDTGGEMRNAKSLRQTRKTASVLVNSLTDRDSIAIIEYNDKAKIVSNWTSDKEETLRSINKDLNFGKRSVFVDALKLATEYLRKSENENRHLVLISDGTDSFDRIEERRQEMRRLMGTNINVHIISYTHLESELIAPKAKRTGEPPHPNPLPDVVIEGLPEPLRNVNKAPKFGTINMDKKLLRARRKRANDLKAGGQFLLELAENTSGMYILPDTKEEMIEKAAFIARIIDSNYVVTYTPKRPLSESLPGEIRVVEVSSKRDGLRVSARRKVIVENPG